MRKLKFANLAFAIIAGVTTLSTLYLAPSISNGPSQDINEVKAQVQDLKPETYERATYDHRGGHYTVHVKRQRSESNSSFNISMNSEPEITKDGKVTLRVMKLPDAHLGFASKHDVDIFISELKAQRKHQMENIKWFIISSLAMFSSITLYDMTKHQLKKEVNTHE